MLPIHTRLIAALLVLMFPAQPLLAITTLHAARAEANGWTGSFVPVAFVPLAALSPAMLEQSRSAIAAQLVKIGYAAEQAQRMSGELTPDDLAVLLANPKMMQKAGEMDAVTKNIIIALIVAGVVVGIVIAANGSININ